VFASAVGSCFIALFLVVTQELRIANGRLARAEDARSIAVDALGASQRAELDDLRARRDRGELPPVVCRVAVRR